jgi:hypothetical protein
LGDTKDNNIRYAHLLYLKGLASKKISEEVCLEIFEKAAYFFKEIIGSERNFFIC